jgi:hypothetical protein
MNDYQTALFEMLVEAEMKKSPATQAVAKFIGPQQMLSDLGAEMKKLAAKDEEMEEGLATAAGIAISLPKMVEWIGKALGWITNKIRKVLGKEKLERNVIVDFAHSWHHLYIVGIKKLLKLVFGKKLPDDKAEKLAERIFYIIVAGLFLSAGLTTVKAFMKGDSILAGVEGALTSVKGSELGAYLGEVLGGLNLVGTAGAAVDAAEVADAIDGAVTLDDLFKGDLTEISTGGSVQGYSLPLGAKPEKNLEENKMNKLKITKGRLRQILAEEVARHQKQKLNEAREGDFVEVIGGSLAGAKGKLMEPVTTTTGEAGFAIALTKDAGKPVFGKAGDEAVVLTSDIKPLSGMAEYGVLDAMAGNPPSKMGQGNKEYMEQYNDILVFTGRDPLPMKQPDQAYLDDLRRGRLEEMGAAEEAAEAAELRAEEEPSSVVNEEALEEGMGSLAARQGFRQGRRAAEDGLSPEEAEAKAKQRALSMSGRELDMLQLAGLPSASPEQYELAMKDALEASASATSDYLTQFARGYHTFRQVSEEKTDKHDAEMKEKGFSDAQAKNLPDELQKSMLKKEVRKMIEEMLKGEGEKTLEGKRPPSMRKRTMKDLDDEAKTRETDFLKKKKGEKKRRTS